MALGKLSAGGTEERADKDSAARRRLSERNRRYGRHLAQRSAPTRCSASPGGEAEYPKCPSGLSEAFPVSTLSSLYNSFTALWWQPDRKKPIIKTA